MEFSYPSFYIKICIFNVKNTSLLRELYNFCSISVYRGLMMAHRAETCSCKLINISVVCDCFDIYTCDLITTAVVYHLKIKLFRTHQWEPLREISK
jgi:hypothetical protein